jgi:hypothetical protein
VSRLLGARRMPRNRASDAELYGDASKIHGIPLRAVSRVLSCTALAATQPGYCPKNALPRLNLAQPVGLLMGIR